MLEDIDYGLIHPGDGASLPPLPQIQRILFFSLPDPGIELSILIFLYTEIGGLS